MQVFDTWDPFYAALDLVLPKFSKKPLFMLLENPETPQLVQAGAEHGEA